MKNNAIIRIVIYSLLILLLAGILVAVLNVNELVSYWHEGHFDPGSNTNAVATGTLNIHKSPSQDAEILGVVASNDTIRITDKVSVNGSEWGMVQEPIEGWVSMENVKMTESSGSQNISADHVDSIEIDWAAGNITIAAGDTETITVTESLNASQKPMVCKLKNGRLEIDYQEGNLNIGFGIHMDVSKDLTVTVPQDFVLRKIDLDMASAEVEIRDLAGTIDEVDIDGASGTCTIENCSVRSLNVDTASGDVRFRGSLEELDFDAASADFVGKFTNTPRSLKMDSMSGDLEITLPQDTGFTASIDAMSSEFSSDFDTTMRNGAYVHGDGSCRIDVDGMSGDVKIHMGN